MTAEVGSAQEANAPNPAGRRTWEPRELAQLLGPALGIVLVSLFSVLRLRCAAQAPEPSAWKKAAAAVEAKFTKGDLIVVAPSWAEPLGRLHLGHLMSVDMVARADNDGFARIWEVSAFGERAPGLTKLEEKSSESFGELEVRLHEQEPARTLYDFAEAGSRARARPSGGEKAPGQVEWTGSIAGRPRMALEEVGFEAHRCLLVVPQPGQSVTLHYGVVPLGSQLVGHVGLGDIFTRRDVRQPGRLEVVLAGQSVSTTLFGVDDGWVRFEAATPPGNGEVEIRLTAVGEGAKNRRICFNLEARE